MAGMDMGMGGEAEEMGMMNFAFAPLADA